MKLHELLAITNNLATQATAIRADLENTFAKKRHLFSEKRTVFTPKEEGAEARTESQSDIQSTVAKELQWVRGHLAKAWNADFQIDLANTEARADIVLENGDTIAVAVPATSLLALAKRLAELLALAKQIPTLDPAKGFSLDPARNGVYIAREVRKQRTQKSNEVVVLYPATIEHPAQTQLVPKDLPIGEIQEQEWSGEMTPKEKSDILDRIEILTRAVRAARSRANEATVDTGKVIAAPLLNFVFSGNLAA